jgi:hypothetical protein
MVNFLRLKSVIVQELNVVVVVTIE